MRKIEWSPEYSVGHLTLDQQHKSIIQLIGMIHDMAEGQDSEYQQLKQVLLYMMEYSQTHLEYEEKLLKQYNFPEFDDHAARHNLFVRKFVELSAEAEKDPHLRLAELSSFLVEWWDDHILKEDMKFREFLADKV